MGAQAHAQPADGAHVAEWAWQYVGTPWQPRGRAMGGADCYGLAWLVWRHEFGLALPEYADRYDRIDPVALGALISGELPQWAEQAAPRVGDAILLRAMGHGSHVGLYVGANRMLHVEEGCDAVVESHLNARWRRRILGYYRPPGLV